jgi:hypothetical protein
MKTQTKSYTMMVAASLVFAPLAVHAQVETTAAADARASGQAAGTARDAGFAGAVNGQARASGQAAQAAGEGALEGAGNAQGRSSLGPPAQAGGDAVLEGATNAQGRASAGVARSARQDAPESAGDGRTQATDGMARTGGEAALEATARMRLPERQVRSVIAEGRASGATAAAIDEAAFAAHARLRVAREAIADENGSEPSGPEIEAGATALAAGAASADLVTIRDAAPGNRSLVISLEALAELRRGGMEGAAAAARIAALLKADVVDARISSAGQARATGLSGTPATTTDLNAAGSLDTTVGGIGAAVTGSLGTAIR